MIIDLESLKRNIASICTEIFEAVGSQQTEGTYQRCLAIDLEEAGVTAVLEPEIKLTYKGNVVGTRRPDILIILASGEKAIIELKAVATDMTLDHRKQLEYYLHYTGVDTGYLINFPHDTSFPAVDHKSFFTYTFVEGLIHRVQGLLLGGPGLRTRNDPKQRKVEIVEITRRSMTSSEQDEAQKKKERQPDLPPQFGITAKNLPCKTCIKQGGYCRRHKNQDPSFRDGV